MEYIFLNFQYSFCSECDPYTEWACREAADYNGLKIGGEGHEFAGEHETKGCYAYSSGKYIGRVYYGRRGTESEMKSPPDESEKYRPAGYDCNYPGIQTKGI